MSSDRPSEQVAAYTCPLWHPSAHFARQYGPGWSEYELMRGARSRAPGHRQPRRPLLGALDEALPSTWEVYNRLAAGHGVDALIWDWYWYDGEPAFHEALEDGFLPARDPSAPDFAVMWVNHHWMTLYPTTTDRGAGFERAFTAPDAEEDIRRSWSYVAGRYLHLDGYWRIADRPFFAVWDVGRVVAGLGRDRTLRLIEDFRALVRSLGHPDVHLHANATMALFADPADLAGATGALADLGFDSCGLYNPLLALEVGDDGPPTYADLARRAAKDLHPRLAAASPIPVYPCASPGWDTTPRLPYPGPGDDVHRHPEQGLAYVEGGTPGEFEQAMRDALAAARENEVGHRIATIGCFNEWTEGQYLLPDVDYGYGMLRALARARGWKDDRTYYPTTAGDGIPPRRAS